MERRNNAFPIPPRRLGRRQLWINLLQRLPLRLQIRLRVMVGRIQLRMPQPASNHGDVHAMGAGSRPGLSLWRLSAVSGAHLMAAILGVRLQNVGDAADSSLVSIMPSMQARM